MEELKTQFAAIPARYPELAGQVAIVTGSTKGIGRGIALRLAREGMKVVINSRTPADVEVTTAAFRDLGAEAIGAPANRLLTFGGDFISVENVAGHASIARQGLAQALDELVAEGWLSESAALDLVEPLMRGNAWELFNMESRTAIARAKVAGLSTSV